MEEQLKRAETEELTQAKGIGEVQWSEASPGMSHHEGDDHHGKRSVVARVKDKARRLKNSFRKKKQGRNGDNASPARGNSLAEEEEEEEEDPEYHGAPIYESEAFPQLSAGILSPETPPSSPAAGPITPKEPGKKIPNSSKNQNTEFGDLSELAQEPESDPSDSRNLAQNVKEILAPAYNMITSATQVIASKIRGSPEPMDSAATATWDELGAKMDCDKDVSVKKYLMEKLEPWEDDRVLSQVPGSDGEQGTVGTVEKIKGAVSSLLGMADINDEGSPEKEIATVSPAKIPVDRSETEMPVSKAPFPPRSSS